MANRHLFAISPWTPPAAQGELGARSVRGARTLPAGSDKEDGQVRVLVVVLLGLVVVLMVLTELCLLQAAATRRRLKRALPPDEERR
jgi:hypothetical protein